MSLQAPVDSMHYQIKQFRCDNGQGERDNATCQYVLMTHGTTYDPHPAYAHHRNVVAEGKICTISETGWAMIIDSQAPVQFWGEEVLSTVYLYQILPTEGLRRKYDHNGYQAPYKMPYQMLHGSGPPTCNADGNRISYHTSLQNLCQIGCYGSRLIPKVQHQGIFRPRLKPCMIVGYTYDSKTLWTIRDEESQKVKAHQKVSWTEKEMHQCHVSMAAMRSIVLDY